jgi:hypothetical protein
MGDDLDFSGLREHVQRSHGIEFIHATEDFQIAGECGGVAGNVDDFGRFGAEDELQDAMGGADGGGIED